MYNHIKREIKTVVLRCLSKVKQRYPVRQTDASTDNTYIFLEIGTGPKAEWTYLIRDDWRDIARSKHRADPLRSLPESWLSKEGHWHGYLVEAHPRNFCALVEKTIADKKLRPFLHRLTFINAAISEASVFSTMGMETGPLSSLFVNRFALEEVKRLHTDMIDNTVTFKLFTVSLETLISALNHKHIHLLRLDVEGAEVPILKAYPWHLKPMLLSVEHHCQEGKVFIQHVLETQGYRIDAQNPEELRGVLREKLSIE